MATDADFEVQVEKTLGFEGGYVNDPHDEGGETNFGISKRSYPDLDIKSLTRDDAINIYKRDWWVRTGIHQLPAILAGKVFDLAVNMGPRTAIALLQRAINHDFPASQIAVDGVIGPRTLYAAQHSDNDNVLACLKMEAAIHYQRIADNNPADARYMSGWLRRANA